MRVFTSNRLLHAKKEAHHTASQQTKDHYRQFTSLLKEVRHEVRIEPVLTKLAKEQFEQ